MSDKFPDLIDPIALAEKRTILSGKLRAGELERVSKLVASNDACIEFHISFGKEAKTPVVSGKIKTDLLIECQSCLETFTMQLLIDFKLGVVTSLEEADRLEIECEPLLYHGEKISLKTMIEDEVLLALPDYPKHDYKCLEKQNSRCDDFKQEVSRNEALNPFSVLSKLKNTGD
jgi:uncharacterized protein